MILESSQVPNRSAVVAFIRRGMMKLATASIKSVKVYGKQAEASTSAWSQDIDLEDAIALSCPLPNPVSQIASSKQKSSSKINKAPSAQPVHAFQSSLPDINPKYFSPGGKYKQLASPPRIARSGSVLNMGVKQLMSLLSSNAQQNWGRYSNTWFSTVTFVKRD